MNTPALPPATEPTPAAPVPGRDHYVVSRAVAPSPPEVFALLTDPARHHETEPTDWVRGPLEPDPAPLTAVDQVFGIEMFHVNTPGRYEVHNRVIAFDQDRTIAWEPGHYGPDGTRGAGGWTWRYDLVPNGEGTHVRMTYDWSAVPGPLRKQFGLPPFAPEFLERSLEALERALGAPAAG